uniref:Insulin-like domain-containing protein n=1 Tax=Lygus hesperus TaxID=30085 RepID=A0A0A9WAL3_LYGHE
MSIVQVLLISFLLASADGSFDNKHPKCSKEWIRYLVMNACNYSKRHTHVLHFVVEESLRELNLKFSETASHSGSSDQPYQRTQRITSKQITIQEGEKKVGSGQTYESLLDYPRHDWIEKETLKEVNLDYELWQRRARSIKMLVEKCCVGLCRMEDFRVLCIM